MKRLILALCMIGASAAEAQDIVIVKPSGGKSSMDWSDFAAAGSEPSVLFDKTVKSDLERSGFFKVSMARGGGEFRVLGEARTSGDRLDVRCQVFKTAASASVFNKTFNAPPKDARRLAHIVSDAIVEALTGRKGFASSRLVVVGKRTGRKELYLCDSDGANVVQLTRDNSISLSPQWSPDGKRIAYTSYLKGNPDIYTIDLGTGARTREVMFPGSNITPAFSPDGSTLAFVASRGGSPDLTLKNLRGGGFSQITKSPAAEASPSWSPDGGRIVYVADPGGKPDLFIIGRAGGAPQRLTTRGSENVEPHWGPQGWIAFSQKSGGRYNICVVDPANPGIVQQVTNDGADYNDPHWARDGRHVACVRTAGYRSGICLVDTKGDQPVMLLDEGGSWTAPAWTY